MTIAPHPPGSGKPGGAAEIERVLELPVDAISNAPLQAPAFYYSTVGANVARDLQHTARLIRDRMAASVIETGGDLIAVRERLEHGQFIAWVETECDLSPRTAQRMMAAAEWAKGKNDTVSHLLPTVIYALSAPSTPAEIHDAALAKIEAGERVEPGVLKAEITEAKQKAAQALRLTPEERARWERREARRKQEIEKDRRDWQEEQDRRTRPVNELADFLAEAVADQERLLVLLEAAKYGGIDSIRDRLRTGRGGVMNAIPVRSHCFMNLSSTWIFNEAHSVASNAAQQPARICNRRIA